MSPNILDFLTCDINDNHYLTWIAIEYNDPLFTITKDSESRVGLRISCWKIVSH